MSDPGDKSTTTNGLGADPLRRLASFKTPRDLSLGGIKPNKKIFTPNLNVTRNKNKGSPSGNAWDQKKDNKNKKDHKNNKNKKNSPKVIKSSGVFSEGLGSVEKRFSWMSYGREDSAASLEKPVLRTRDRAKIDRELEDRKIKKVLSDGNSPDEDDAEFKRHLELDAPTRLPMGDGGRWKSRFQPPVKVKQEYDNKTDLGDEVCALRALEQKPMVDLKKESAEDTEVVDMLRTDEPTLILLQLPASLPGRGGSADDDAPLHRPTAAEAPSTSNEQSADQTPVEDKCHLSSLEEGRIGRLRVHRSGRVTFVLGNSDFEVVSGVKSSFHQEVVSVAVDEPSRSANLVSLGVLQRKLVVFPHWQGLLQDMPA